MSDLSNHTHQGDSHATPRLQRTVRQDEEERHEKGQEAAVAVVRGEAHR